MPEEQKKKRGFMDVVREIRERFRKFKTAGAKEREKPEGPAKIRTGPRARRLEPNPQQRKAVRKSQRKTTSRSQTSRR